MKSYLALIVALLAGPALADAPLPPPEELRICSPAGKVCATSDPATNVTLVSSQTSRQKPWTIPGWHRWLFVSDDGESVVVGYGGMNLVPVDVTLEEPVLFFYNKGKLVRTVTLGDLYERKSQLRRTMSHFAWADMLGINRANQLVVQLVNGKQVAFAASTGQVQPLVSD
jgi:hypothetical protein